ncbi:uncharacterized protein LOC124265411 [Haliotis rubra]|uniref:uncharacterized protein LOC124265411 n=1 Tax=Haliotis rubra TaxID=36100 RepID=UPI001EE5F749|nr:uncharacterized protein LOC124265411 [Haliotis rubra]
MATEKKLKDNHLTCVICTEVYTDPATLQCNHTFCKSCLLKYTKTQSEATHARSIPCPSCRQQTKMTNPDSPVEEWVSHLKPNHVIQSLMDDFGPGTEASETGERSVCRNQQKKTPATSWCSSCDSSFCDDCLTLLGAMPFSRDHEVVVLSESTKFKMTPKCSFMCKHHLSKQIDLFYKYYRPAPRRVVFTHDMVKVAKGVDELYLGDAEAVQEVCDRESVPTLYQTIHCKKVHGMAHPMFKDITALAVDGIKVAVVVDYINKGLFTYYTHDRHGPKYIKLSAGPCTIIQLTKWHVAVTVPYSNEIVIVKVYPEPVILSTIKTNRSYYGLACLSPSRLVAGGIERTDILDMEGNVLKSINTGKVSSPDYIHVTGNRNLIVSEEKNKSLVSVTSDGQVVFTCPPTGDCALKYPQGITTTSTGDILVVDRDSHKVIQLTESGEFVRDVLTARDGIDSPRGICLDTDGLLYITCHNCWKIFRF